MTSLSDVCLLDRQSHVLWVGERNELARLADEAMIGILEAELCRFDLEF